MKQKYFINLAGLVLGVSLLATPVLADTYTTGSWGNGEDGATDVTVTVPPTYSVTIPASFSFSAIGEEGTSTDIAISKNSQLNTDAVVSVKLVNSNTLQATKLYNNGANTSVIPFTVLYGDSKTTYTSGTETTILSATGAEIGAATSDLTTGVYVDVTSFAPATTAGTHTGTVNFSVSYAAGTP